MILFFPRFTVVLIRMIQVNLRIFFAFINDNAKTNEIWHDGKLDYFCANEILLRQHVTLLDAVFSFLKDNLTLYCYVIELAQL